MTELYFMNSCDTALSGAWAWQKEIYHRAKRWQHCLFTEEGIKDLAARLQKQADGMKGKDRTVKFSRYFNDRPAIGIGPGDHYMQVNFTKVNGSFAPMVECKEAVRGEIFSISAHSDGYKEVTIRFYDGFPLKTITGKDVLVTMEEVE